MTLWNKVSTAAKQKKAAHEQVKTKGVPNCSNHPVHFLQGADSQNVSTLHSKEMFAR